MEHFNFTRLKSARIIAGLSLQELSEKLELTGTPITRQSLYKYERGEVIPNEGMLRKIADILSVEYAYFFLESKIELERVDFRKFPNLSSKEEDRIIEITKDKLQNYLAIEKILRLKNEFVSPLTQDTLIESLKDIEEASLEVRKKWEIGIQQPISNVVELLEDNNIKVIPLNADESFDGLAAKVDNRYAVIVYNKTREEKVDRLRFTLLHELAHLILKFDPKLSYNQIEILCHQFAGAMLMPLKALKEEVGENRSKLSIQELGSIKMQFGISMQAIVMRAQDLQIITKSAARQFFSFIKQVGWKIDEPEQYNYTGSEKSYRFKQLTFRAVAEEIISKNYAAELLGLSMVEFDKKYAFL